MGIRVDLPFEQHANPFVEQAFEHETFFTRLHHFVIASDAFVVVPGGIGTVLETLMIWQLLQVRHADNVPLILVGKMWKGLVEWARGSMLDPRLALANAEDLQIPRCVETATRRLRWFAICTRGGRASEIADGLRSAQPARHSIRTAASVGH
jgi:predicted Rossmann-fold nucleotide-binding protein